ncbi:5-hydroxytryptamine receptor 1B isoform X3 [Patella vulgata]|nr:5-hydroxytryptamine receptor 1B isoform X3 [Patella vulgata]
MMNSNKTLKSDPGVAEFDLSSYANSSHERGFINSAKVGISICVWNIAVNLLLIFFILCFRRTRRQFVMIQITNIAVIDLLTSALVNTLTIYYEFEQWKLGQTMCEAWLILDVMLPFAAFLGIMLLYFDRLIFAMRPSFYYRLFNQLPHRCIYLAIPWVLSSIIIVPIWLFCEVNTIRLHFMCIYALTESAMVASWVIALFLPCMGLIMLTVLVLVTVVNQMPTNLNEFSSVTFEEHRLSQRAQRERHYSIVLALCIVSFCALVMQLPSGTIILPKNLSWLRSATPGVRPIIWFLFTEIKFSCCCCVHAESDSTAPEAVPMTSYTHQEALTSVSNANGSTIVT